MEAGGGYGHPLTRSPGIRNRNAHGIRSRGRFSCTCSWGARPPDIMSILSSLGWLRAVGVAQGFRLRAKRFGETRRSLGGGGQPCQPARAALKGCATIASIAGITAHREWRPAVARANRTPRPCASPQRSRAALQPPREPEQSFDDSHAWRLPPKSESLITNLCIPESDPRFNDPRIQGSNH
jgi:hypothetical protein